MLLTIWNAFKIEQFLYFYTYIFIPNIVEHALNSPQCHMACRSMLGRREGAAEINAFPGLGLAPPMAPIKAEARETTFYNPYIFIA
jgi:hypothetical protein